MEVIISSDFVNARPLNRHFAILIVLGLVSLLPQAAWSASARTGSPLRVSKQAIQAAQGEVPAAANIRHVLLLTINGAHAFDVENYIQSHPQSALAKLKAMGCFTRMLTFPYRLIRFRASWP